MAYLRRARDTVRVSKDSPARRGCDGECGRASGEAEISCLSRGSRCRCRQVLAAEGCSAAAFPAEGPVQEAARVRQLLRSEDRWAALRALDPPRRDWPTPLKSLASGISELAPGARGFCASSSTGSRGAAGGPALFRLEVCSGPPGRETSAGGTGSPRTAPGSASDSVPGTLSGSGRTELRSAGAACSSGGGCTRTAKLEAEVDPGFPLSVSRLLAYSSTPRSFRGPVAFPALAGASDSGVEVLTAAEASLAPLSASAHPGTSNT